MRLSKQNKTGEAKYNRLNRTIPGKHYSTRSTHTNKMRHVLLQYIIYYTNTLLTG